MLKKFENFTNEYHSDPKGDAEKDIKKHFYKPGFDDHEDPEHWMKKALDQEDFEASLGNEITCQNCGWQWDEDAARDHDPESVYTCQQCGHDTEDGHNDESPDFGDLEPNWADESVRTFDNFVKEEAQNIRTKPWAPGDDKKEDKKENFTSEDLCKCGGEKEADEDACSDCVDEVQGYHESVIVNFDEFIKEDDGGGVAMAGLSTVSGMGDVSSAQPASQSGAAVTGDGTEGSGDYGNSSGGPYSKKPANTKKKKKKNKKRDAKSKSMSSDKVLSYSALN